MSLQAGRLGIPVHKVVAIPAALEHDQCDREGKDMIRHGTTTAIRYHHSNHRDHSCNHCAELEADTCKLDPSISPYIRLVADVW